MITRVKVRDGQSTEDAQRVFDAQLGVPGWTVPGRTPRPVEPRDAGAPWWWQGAEDASQSFLASMGVSLND